MTTSETVVDVTHAYGSLLLPNWRVGVVTILEPNQHGGLETYIRMLTSEIVKKGIPLTLNGAQLSEQMSIAAKWKSRVSSLLPFSTRRRFRWIARWIAINQGRRWANDLVRNCDIVHFVGTGWDLAGFPLLNAVRSRGAVMTCWPAVHPGSWGCSQLDIDFYKSVDAVFVQSEFEATYLNGLGVPYSKLVRCGCASVSTEIGDGERFRRTHGLDGKKIVLFIGRKSQGKGYHSLRSTIAMLAEERDDLAFVSIGRDVDAPYPPVDSKVDIDLGLVNESIKHDVLAACDVFVLPSEAESFGIVYVEAWSYGKPVVCGIAPASRELVTRHKGGLTSDGTPESLANAIRSLLDNPSLAHQMGDAGKKAVESDYTIDVIVKRHYEVWDRLYSDTGD